MKILNRLKKKISSSAMCRRSSQSRHKGGSRLYNEVKKLIHVVNLENGEYSARETIPLKAFYDLQKARDFLEAVKKELNIIYNSSDEYLDIEEIEEIIKKNLTSLPILGNLGIELNDYAADCSINEYIEIDLGDKNE